MAVLIRTRDVPAKLRLDAWKSVVCDTLGPLDMRADPDVPLRGEIGAGRLGPVVVGTVRTATPHSVHRTAGLIRNDGRELYRVVLIMSGSVLLRQGDRTARLRRGEFAIYDFNRPYELRYEAAVRLAVFGFPHEMLALPADPVAQLAAVPIVTDEGTGAIAAPLLRRVALDLETYQPASASRLSSVVMNVVTATVAERVELTGSLPVEERQRTLLLRIHEFVEQHLGEIDLGPAVVAAAHHISVRHLHRLFERQHTTVAAWIRHRRLERCRADLADPALVALPVSAVACRWGLPDSAQFSRMFRRTYGASPAEYRRTCLMPQG
ncbi:MAG TPA: helix-turn-helix domain-containing protein [Streptosporangiaceae bacterium]|jgi:AraC-like DNA-binding protein